MEDAGPERQINLQIDAETMRGVYANFANITFSQYEFTLTFSRVDHEQEEGTVEGIVVARINLSHKFMSDLLEAMKDAYSKWSTTEGIRNLPETPPPPGT